MATKTRAKAPKAAPETVSETALIRLNADAFNDACGKFTKADGRQVASFRDQAKLLGIDNTTVYRSRTGGALGSKMLSAMARTFGLDEIGKLLILK